MRAHYWRCSDCNWIGVEAEMLRGPHPFSPGQQIDGCPECREIDSFEMLCDVTGCKEIAGCGWPSAEGYRHTCHKHAVQLDAANPHTAADKTPYVPVSRNETW